MKALFVSQPGEGHLNCLLPLARELRRVGHEAAFAVAASFCPAVERHGFRALPAGLDWLESETLDTFPEARRLRLPELGSWYLGELFADRAVHAMVPDLLEICRSFEPDVLLRNDYEFATCIVSEISGIPQATASAIFLVSRERLEAQIREPLAFARSAFGLPPYPALDMLHPYLYLSYVPRSWHSNLLPTVHALRPVRQVAAEPGELPGWSRQLGDRPTVYASMGTVNNRQPHLFPTLLEALREEPINLILTLGRNQDPDLLGPQPDNVHIERYIPQDDLFPICDLFINNASYFTVLAAVLHGVPVLMTPLHGDEPTQASHFARLGVGRVVRQPGTLVPPLAAEMPEYRAEALCTVVRQMLANRRFRAGVERARDEIMGLPPPEYAVRLLTRLATERRPIEHPDGRQAKPR